MLSSTAPFVAKQQSEFVRLKYLQSYFCVDNCGCGRLSILESASIHRCHLFKFATHHRIEATRDSDNHLNTDILSCAARTSDCFVSADLGPLPAQRLGSENRITFPKPKPNLARRFALGHFLYCELDTSTLRSNAISVLTRRRQLHGW